ncbi:MAG TPA: iron-only hydrogenase system regulator [Ruminococcaceae bacterium]|nr:iron-only hydrogenase system regulator [Oscillospiraceae bacterium]
MEQETRVAIISMIISDETSVPAVNELLHKHGRFIRGRMGLPYRERGLNIISVVADAPADIISALSGKLGRLKGVTSKTVFSKENTGV